MRQMRLLAPAGSPEALRAAVYAGADAVYAGGSQYGARSFAANFDREELREAVAFCHQWGVAFYQTLNTLIGDREREDFLRQAEYANEIGVDGVIVQDVGMMAQIARRFPDLPISGSTQMSVTTLDGVLRAQQLGASRVVLARELPLSQIAYICERSPIEIEVFLHGALCMCYSGQCYMSALLGQRSGNRGQCAQPCRLPYRLESGRQAHPLSLKDLCGAGWLEQLRQAGVSVLKIEGRMKRPEYVGVVTDVYQRLLRERREPTAQEMERLTTIFSRQGFTQGYLEDHTGPAMFGTRSENEDTPAFRQLVKEAAAEYQEKHARRRVPVRFSCSLRAGEPFALTLEDGIHSVTARGEVPQPALRRAVGEEEIRAQLSRLGGTPFVLESLTGEVQEG
ncbi:MAG: peptidase U32 family protein, partial [Eubacteriales bacterium]